MARSSSVLHSAFVNSLDGSSFGLCCLTDSTARAVRLSDSAAAGHRNLQPHTLMTSSVYDSFPPILWITRKIKAAINSVSREEEMVGVEQGKCIGRPKAAEIYFSRVKFFAAQS